MENMTGVILAGGKSLRMGQDKAFLTLESKALVDSLCQLLYRLFPQVVIVTNSPIKCLSLNADIVTDIYPHMGALGGIFTGLVFSSHPYSFVVACDMPFVSERLVKYMAGLKDGYDVVIPEGEAGLEPLHAIYSKNCLKPIKRLLKENNLKIIDFFPALRVRKVKKEELKPFLETVPALFNINTPADYEQAVRIGKEG